MARAGDVMEDPGTGARAVFRTAAADTNGQLLRMDFTVPPHVPVSGEHIHPRMEESFEVLSGTFGFLVDGQEHVGGAGHRVVVPPGVRHNFWLVGDEAGEIRFEFRPALRAEEVFETLWSLARDGKIDRKTGRPGILQAAVLLSEYRNEYVLARPPLPVQRVVFGVLAPVGKLLGYRARRPYPFAGGTAAPAAPPG